MNKPIYLSLRDVIRRDKKFTDAIENNIPVIVVSKNEPLFVAMSLEQAHLSL